MSGYIRTVNISTGSKLQKNDILFVYDEFETKFRLDRARDTFQQTIRNEYKKCLEQSVSLTKLNLKKLEYQHHEKQLERGEKLRQSKLLAESTYDDIVFSYDSSSVNKEISSLELSLFQYLNQEPILERPSVKLSRHAYEEELHYQRLATIETPTAGYVYELMVYPNQYVEKGEVLAVIVSSSHIRVEANVLESEVGRIKPLMKVEIASDVYKEQKLHGHIHSIVPSTASSFSPIPRNNTDSNWIKVSQRVPVLIELDDKDKRLLPIGSSAKIEVKLNTFVEEFAIEKPASGFPVDPDRALWQESKQAIQQVIEHESKLIQSNSGQALCRL